MIANGVGHAVRARLDRLCRTFRCPGAAAVERDCTSTAIHRRVARDPDRCRCCWACWTIRGRTRARPGIPRSRTSSPEGWSPERG